MRIVPDPLDDYGFKIELEINRGLVATCASHALRGHLGQTRKYTGRPYVEHPDRVALMVARLRVTSDEMVGAAFCHDLGEDNPEYWAKISPQLPVEVVRIVTALTNPSKLHPDLPRAERKRMDREHLYKAYPAAWPIKLCDRIDNVTDLTGSEATNEFKQLYAEESRLLAAIFKDNSALGGLHRRLIVAIERLEEDGQ